MSQQDSLGIALIDSLTGQFYSVNAVFAKITGRTEEALRNFNWMSITHADDLQEELNNMALLNAGKISGFQLEKRYRHRDGKFVWINMTIAPVYVEDKSHPRHLCMIEDISGRKQSEEEARNLERYDSLTNLPNLNLFIDRLRSAQLKSTQTHFYGAVLFLDLDRFETFNEKFGRDCGDLLLIEVAKRIQSVTYGENIVARLGGDEFVVLIEALDENAEIASVKVVQHAERIRASLNAPYQLTSQDHHSSSSIGMILFKGREITADSLLKQVEIAMYQAKGLGGNTARFFDSEIQNSGETRPVMEAYLRRALPSKELKLYYQVQLDSELHPVGAEVLLHWNHPTRGVVSPAEFVPIAEESFLIFDIGNWVLENTCQQLSFWSENEETKNLTLAVNVSAQQFKQYDFVGKIATALRVYNVKASRLTLEFKEAVVVNDLTDGLLKMHALKALGVGLSIDNFGAGNVSSTYLQQLPLDQIKIDKRFVRDISTDPNEAVMVQAIIDMTKNLCLQVVAEGVETEAQLSFLKEQGCMAYQGFLFSKPIAIEQFEALLPQTGFLVESH